MRINIYKVGDAYQVKNDNDGYVYGTMYTYTEAKKLLKKAEKKELTLTLFH